MLNVYKMLLFSCLFFFDEKWNIAYTIINFSLVLKSTKVISYLLDGVKTVEYSGYIEKGRMECVVKKVEWSAFRSVN